jgi:hypothetical protein
LAAMRDPRRVTARAGYPSRLAELVIGPATSGLTRWLALKDDGQ